MQLRNLANDQEEKFHVNTLKNVKLTCQALQPGGSQSRLFVRLTGNCLVGTALEHALTCASLIRVGGERAEPHLGKSP